MFKFLNHKTLQILGVILTIGSITCASAPKALAGIDDPNFKLETEHFTVAYEFAETEELAQKTADELENIIWKTEIDTLGFKSPLRFDGDKFLVYIDDNNEEIQHPKVLGITVASSDGEIYIAMSENIEEWSTYANTLAHEFFHVIQYRYLSPNGENFQSAPSSSFESGAVWIESEVYPELDEYAAYMNVFFSQPNGSVFLGQRPGLSYWEYSLAIWVEWIEQTLGSDIIDGFWRQLYSFLQEGEDITNSFWPYVSYHQKFKEAGTNVLKMFHEFTVANINTDQTYEIGENIDDAFISASYSIYPVNNNADNYVSLFGSKYFRFIPQDTDGNLKLTVNADPNLGMMLSLVPLENGQILMDKVVKNLRPVGQQEGSIVLENAHEYEEVIGIISAVDSLFSVLNTSDEIFRIDKTFTFKAEWVQEAPKQIVLEKVDIPSESPYSDLETGHKNYKAITYLSAKKVLQGYDDGTFKPENDINRAEFFKILVASLNVKIDPEVYRDCYPDVHDEWFAKYICYGTEQGWVEGYPDGMFKPEQPINKVEATKMVLESRGISTVDLTLLGYDKMPYTDTPETEWYYPYLQIAYGLNLLEEQNEFFSPGNSRRRSEVSEETFRLTTLLDAQKVNANNILYSEMVDEEVIE